MRKKRRIIHKITFAILILFILSLSGLCIYFGLYFNRLANSRNIIGNSLESIRKFSKKYVLMDLKYDIGDSFSLDGTIKYKLSSDLYYRQSTTDEESLKRFNYIKNLNGMNSSFSYKQNKNDKKLYFETNNKIGVEDIYSMKFYSEDSTKYYLINDIVPNYVNKGNFNYFENYGENITTKDNINYLYDYMFNAFTNAIPEEEIKISDGPQSVNGESKYLHRVSIKFTDIVIKETLNNLLKELRKDERANSIITNIYGDFANFSFDDEKFYLENDESYTLNIYTDRLFYRVFKYEVIYIHGNERKTYYFEPTNEGGRFAFIEGDKIIYRADFRIGNDSIDGVIYNSSDNEIGSLKLSRDNTGLDFNYLFNDKDNSKDIVYTSKYSNVNKGHSYTNNRKVSFKIIENGISKLNGDIEFDTNVSDDVSIMEDASKAVLYSTLVDDVKTNFDNKLENVKIRMEK